jgi:hypothetical protein
LRDGVIRMTSRDAMSADVIRLLRGPRVALELGFRIEPQTEAAIAGMATRLPQAAAERIRDELFRMLRPPVARAGVALMADLGVLQAVLPEAGGIPTAPSVAGCLADLANQTLRIPSDGTDLGPRLAEHFGRGVSGGRTRGELVIFAALFVDRPNGGAVAGRRLRLSEREVRLLAAVSAGRDVLGRQVGAMTDLEMYRYFRLTGEAGLDAAILHFAAPAAGETAAAATALRSLATAWFLRPEIVDPPPLVRGDELAAAGVPPGPEIGLALERVREGQVTGEVSTRAQAVAAALEGRTG